MTLCMDMKWLLASVSQRMDCVDWHSLHKPLIAATTWGKTFREGSRLIMATARVRATVVMMTMAIINTWKVASLGTTGAEVTDTDKHTHGALHLRHSSYPAKWVARKPQSHEYNSEWVCVRTRVRSAVRQVHALTTSAVQCIEAAVNVQGRPTMSPTIL